LFLKESILAYTKLANHSFIPDEVKNKRKSIALMEAISMPAVKDTHQAFRAFCRHDNADSRSEDNKK
jgi:hypothetical protein